MDLSAFYGAFSPACFALLGLWLVAVQVRLPVWEKDPERRRRSYGVALHFALPGLEVITTPGHTEGHQCVVVRGDGAFDLLIGDAAYTPRQYAEPGRDHLPPGQASDVETWRESIRKIRSLRPEHVHFCHHTAIVHS